MQGTCVIQLLALAPEAVLQRRPLAGDALAPHLDAGLVDERLERGRELVQRWTTRLWIARSQRNPRIGVFSKSGSRPMWITFASGGGRGSGSTTTPIRGDTASAAGRCARPGRSELHVVARGEGDITRRELHDRDREARRESAERGHDVEMAARIRRHDQRVVGVGVDTRRFGEGARIRAWRGRRNTPARLLIREIGRGIDPWASTSRGKVR